MATKPLLIVVRQADARPDQVLGRSWQLPCAFCGETCWVDPEALFATRAFQLVSLRPVEFQQTAKVELDKTICCVRCIGPSADARTDLSPEQRDALRRIGAAFARLVERGGAS